MGDTDLSSILGGVTSLAGLGVSAYDQQNSYNALQQALNTIGPTQLNPYTLTGPGGMSSGYNANGGASISLGSLDPAFSTYANSAQTSAGNYDPAVLNNLLNMSNGTTTSALSGLNSAYSQNNAYQNAAMTQANSLNQTYGQTYNNTLFSLQAQQQPQVQQQAFGLQNTLFGNGVLGSTGAASGALAAGNFGSQVNAMNAQDSLSAQQQALSAMQGQAGIASSLSGTGNSLLSNAFANFGNTNQLVSGLNTAQLNNSLSAAQGAGSLNTLGLTNYMAALQTGTAQGTTRNQSLFPYANVALGLSNTNTATTMLGQALSGAGSSLSGSTSGLGSLLSGLGGLFGSSSSGIPSGQSSVYDSLGGSNPFAGYGGYSTPDLQSIDTGALDDYNIGFNSAGGEAATSGVSSAASPSLQPISLSALNGLSIPNIGSAASPATGSGTGDLLGMGGNTLGIAGGLSQGGVGGYSSAAINSAALAGKAGVFGANTSTANTGIGAAGNILGLYQGLKTGGVAGDTGAAINAAGLATKAGALGGTTGTLASDLPYAGLALGAYNFATQDTKSGATGSDALGGAETGAEAGSAFGPVGTVVGAVVGAVGGAIASAFGPGKIDPENANWNSFVGSYNKLNSTQQTQMLSQVNPSTTFQLLAGVMDAKDDSSGHSEELEQAFGKGGENSFVTQMTSQINSAISSGKLSKNATPTQIYNSVVTPWLSGKGVTIGQDSATQKGAVSTGGGDEGNAMQGVITSLIGQWQSGQFNSKTPMGVAGQTISGLQAYGA